MTTTKRKQSCFGSTVEIQIRQFFQQLILFRWEHLRSFRRERKKNEVISEATQLKKCRTRSTCDAMLATWSNLHLSAFFRLIDFSYHGSYYYFLQTAILEFSGKGQLPLVAVSRRTNPNNCLFRNWDERLMAFGANGSLTGRLKSVEQVFDKKASLQQQQQLQTIG